MKGLARIDEDDSQQLAEARIDSAVEIETPGFAFDAFESAWEVLAGVTAAKMTPAREAEAKAALREAMWPADGGPRYFSNQTQYIVGRRS